MSRPVRSDRVPVLAADRLLAEALVPEERVLDEEDVQERRGEVHADVEGGVADRDPDAVPGGEPGEPQAVRDVVEQVDDVDRARLDQPAAPVGVEVLARLQVGKRHLARDPAQPVDVVAQARVLDPEDVDPSVAVGVQAADRVLRRPTVVGVDEQRRPGPDRLGDRPQALSFHAVPGGRP